VTLYLASLFEPRLSLSAFGLVTAVVALASGILAFTETLPFARRSRPA